MQIECVPIDSIFLDQNNARTHSAEQLHYIAESLKRFSQQKPIVVNAENIIVAGNGTYLAAKELLGWKTILIVHSKLDKQEGRAYSIADNQIALHSEWNLDSLSEHIKTMAEWNPLQNWESLGFDAEVIAPLLESDLTEMSDEDRKELNDFIDGKTGDEDKPIMASPIKVTQEQWLMINMAINTVKHQTGDRKLTAGRAIELICADYLSGSSVEEQEN